MKIQGFNDRQQKIFEALSNGQPKTIGALKELFAKEVKANFKANYEGSPDAESLDAMQQSFVRNHLRLLIRDGWIDGPQSKIQPKSSMPRGTYKLSRTGKTRLAKKVSMTPSVGETRKKKEPNGAPKKKNGAAKKTKVVAKASKETVKAKMQEKARKQSKRLIAREKAAQASRQASVE